MEYKIELRNKKEIICQNSQTILEAAIHSGITLEHSCLSGRCRSCIVQVLEGKIKTEQEEFVLTDADKAKGYILSCNSKPLSNLKLNIEDLGDINLPQKRTFPCKIESIKHVNSDVLKIVLRLPPTSNFVFLPGQYVNLIKGSIKRSYSIANNHCQKSNLEFFIKKYDGGVMSHYWFNEAKKNDLLRLEGPLGTFFYRNKAADHIILMATGTGIAPIKAILEQFIHQPELLNRKKLILAWGGRNIDDFFWKPKVSDIDFEFIPVLSRASKDWNGGKGYIQDELIRKIENFEKAQVYACGSNNMIKSAKNVMISKGLPETEFYSDAFICSN